MNGRPVEFRMDPDTPLLWALRDAANLTGTKYGCGVGDCGACMVIVDGEALRSCLITIAEAEGRYVTTIEGLSRDRSHPVQQALVAEQAIQCGFCTPGMVIMVRDALARGRCESESQVRQELAGNLCRCTGYAGIVKAALLARDRLNAAGAPAPSSQQKEASLP